MGPKFFQLERSVHTTSETTLRYRKSWTGSSRRVVCTAKKEKKKSNVQINKDLPDFLDFFNERKRTACASFRDATWLKMIDFFLPSPENFFWFWMRSGNASDSNPTENHGIIKKDLIENIILDLFFKTASFSTISDANHWQPFKRIQI